MCSSSLITKLSNSLRDQDLKKYIEKQHMAIILSSSLAVISVCAGGMIGITLRMCVWGKPIQVLHLSTPLDYTLRPIIILVLQLGLMTISPFFFKALKTHIPHMFCTKLQIQSSSAARMYYLQRMLSCSESSKHYFAPSPAPSTFLLFFLRSFKQKKRCSLGYILPLQPFFAAYLEQ